MSERVRDSRFGGFLSYTRRDDDYEQGRITDMRRRLAAEVHMQLGEPFVIFQDTKGYLYWTTMEGPPLRIAGPIVVVDNCYHTFVFAK